MNWYKKAQPEDLSRQPYQYTQMPIESTDVGEKRTVTAYHGSKVPIKNFSRDFGAQGVMWFSEDKDKILQGESGACSSEYIMKVELTVDKSAGWDEYNKLYLQ